MPVTQALFRHQVVLVKSSIAFLYSHGELVEYHVVCPIQPVKLAINFCSGHATN